MNYQYLLVDSDDPQVQREGITADNGHALGLYMNGHIEWNLHYSIGADFVYVPDATPFVQTVKDKSSGAVSQQSSDITGYSVYAEAGPKFYLHSDERVIFGAMLGYKFNDIERSVFRCDGCDYQSLDSFKSSAYIRPMLEYHVSRDIQLEFYVTHYFEDSGFSQGIGFKVRFY